MQQLNPSEISDIIKQRTALAAYQPLLNAFVHDVDAIIGATPQHFSSSQQMAPGKLAGLGAGQTRAARWGK